ncbi:glycosyltransferase [Microbacterium sp. W1N]|uniref:glycosyltransferase n=1 Tax=Microbacterium festucae TaxID=2977531 RepID=UPI0021BF3B55|nr:glycosyltransferase [Microbacterium festucae]MCT9818998.1 glycosyltransferase [Microbacterium festucae]
MKILVYPHDLNMGGSQTNAIELAAAVTRLGHECIVFGRRGTLCTRIDELGLEFIESPDPGRRPSRRVALALRRIVAERGIDVVHGYEWPPALEAAWAVRALPGVAAMSTVMSMAVAPFLPRWMPLVVGTQQISAREQRAGRSAVNLIEPPVDLEHNSGVGEEAGQDFRRRWGLSELPTVVVVSRLVPELKSEGILTAIDVAGALAGSSPFQLLIVGDGRARPEMERRAVVANQRAGRRVVIFTGELSDPRAAYATADVVLGMGGSALRALAFAKPLVVQGEHGYFRTLDEHSVDEFRWRGWYGVGSGIEHGAGALTAQLLPLLADARRRRELAAFGRRVVEDYGLTRAARTQVTLYRDAVAAAARGAGRVGRAAETVRCVAGFARYLVTQRVARWRGRQRADDFNADPVASAAETARRTGGPIDPAGPIVYFPGVGWDTLAGTDRQLVTALAAHAPVIWVDTPHSVLRARDRVVPAISHPHPNVVRLRAATFAGVQRPLLRGIANRRRGEVARRYLAEHGLVPRAVIASTTAPMLALTTDLGGQRIYYATDDYVEAAEMWGVSRRYLGASREQNLAAADLVLAVTEDLARHLQRGPAASGWLPNGADVQRFATLEHVAAADLPLRHPIAGVIGQFNARTDLDLLRAVHASGTSLLLVGPRWFADDADARTFDDLIARPRVHWVDAVPRDQLAPYLRAVDVGLTPYRDSMFNRRSYPLKTVEYLAAGVAVVTSDVASTHGLDERFVVGSDGADSFAAHVADIARTPHDRVEIRRTVAAASWEARAMQMAAWLQPEAVR